MGWIVDILRNAAVGTAERGGGANQLFAEMKEHLIVRYTPLWHIVNLLHILCTSFQGDQTPAYADLCGPRPEPPPPDDQKAADAALAECLSDWALDRLQSLQRWLSASAASIAAVVFHVVSNLPLVQFLLLGSQWGSSLQPPYGFFIIENYWGMLLRFPVHIDEGLQFLLSKTIMSVCAVRRLTGKEDVPLGTAHVNVGGLPSLLISLFITRIDFLLRFIISLLYGAHTAMDLHTQDQSVTSTLLTQPVRIACAGHYFLTNPLRRKKPLRVPVLLSLVGYLDTPDGGDPRTFSDEHGTPTSTCSLWGWSPGALKATNQLKDRAYVAVWGR